MQEQPVPQQQNPPHAPPFDFDLQGSEARREREAEEAEKKALHASIAALEARQAELANRQPTNKATESDTENDTQKKSGKAKLPMTAEAADCARLYRESLAKGDKTSMKSIVEKYAKEHGESASYIMRVLNDNPDQWERR